MKYSDSDKQEVLSSLERACIDFNFISKAKEHFESENSMHHLAVYQEMLDTFHGIETDHLIPFEKSNCRYNNGKFAAKNIRKDLKKYFKTKFSVTSDFNSVNVYYKSGELVTRAEVEKILNKFSTGHFNAYDDYHWAEDTPFNEVFGGVQYLFIEM